MKKALLIGHGRFGKILFEKLQKLAEVEITTRNWREKLLGKDWVVVATPVASHAEITQECLEKGFNVFTEKPLNENPDKVQALTKLAKIKNKNLYVDDVFLWRPEYKYIKSLGVTISEISFRMTKYGTFDDSLLSAHIYHDLYMLVDLTNFAPISNIEIIKAECPLEPGRIDVLEFSLTAGEIRVHASYDRTQEVKQKSIAINKNIVWQDKSLTINDARVTLPEQDAISSMLEAVLSEKADFAYNNKLAFEATHLMDRLRKVLQNIALESTLTT